MQLIEAGGTAFYKMKLQHGEIAGIYIITRFIGRFIFQAKSSLANPNLVRFTSPGTVPRMAAGIGPDMVV